MIRPSYRSRLLPLCSALRMPRAQVPARFTNLAASLNHYVNRSLSVLEYFISSCRSLSEEVGEEE